MSQIIASVPTTRKAIFTAQMRWSLLDQSAEEWPIWKWQCPGYDSAHVVIHVPGHSATWLVKSIGSLEINQHQIGSRASVKPKPRRLSPRWLLTWKIQHVLDRISKAKEKIKSTSFGMGMGMKKKLGYVPMWSALRRGGKKPWPLNVKTWPCALKRNLEVIFLCFPFWRGQKAQDTSNGISSRMLLQRVLWKLRESLWE